MPQLNFVYFPSQILWLIVSFITLYLFLKYLSLPKIESLIDNRISSIKKDLEEAAKLKDKALALQLEYERHLINTHDEIAKMRAETIANFSEEKDRQIKTLHKKFLMEENKALKAIESAKTKALKEMPKYSINHAVLLIEKITGKKPDLDSITASYGKLYD